MNKNQNCKDTFEFLSYDHESILDGNKIREYIEHKIVVNEDILDISGDENKIYQ